MSLPFSKYHALGNDFIVLSTPSRTLPPARVQALCDRHRGIGADGILLLHPHPDPSHDARMIVLNADGSNPEMCGNGLRCAAFHAAASSRPPPATTTLRIATDAGSRTCSVQLDPGSHQATVAVDMPPARLAGTHPIRLQNRSLTGHLADLGNPHLVIFDRLDDETFNHLSRLASDPAFPTGINVSLAHPHAPTRTLHLRVWERGVGPTLACGTAACATVAVSIATGLLAPDGPVTVHLPGGPLHILIDPRTHRILMTGPATHVFDGQLHDPPACDPLANNKTSNSHRPPT